MTPVHLRFGGYQPPTSVHCRAVERALLVQAVAPLVAEQRQVFGEQLFGYLE